MFWRLVPVEIIAIIEGRNKLAAREYKAQADQAHYLANLVSFAFHDPKNMPKPGGDAPEQNEASQEVADAQVRAFFMALSMKGDKK